MLIIIFTIVVSASHLVHVRYTFRVCPFEYYCFLKDCIVSSFNFMVPFQVLYVAPWYVACMYLFLARNVYGQQIIYDLRSLPFLIAILNHVSKNCTSSEVLLNLVLLFVCFRFGVTGFPTLKFFPKDNKEGEEVTTFKVQVCDVMYYVTFLPACPKRCSQSVGYSLPFGQSHFY